jgi:hypothetical protein
MLAVGRYCNCVGLKCDSLCLAELGIHFLNVLCQLNLPSNKYSLSPGRRYKSRENGNGDSKADGRVRENEEFP